MHTSKKAFSNIVVMTLWPLFMHDVHGWDQLQYAYLIFAASFVSLAGRRTVAHAVNAHSTCVLKTTFVRASGVMIILSWLFTVHAVRSLST